MRFVFNSCLENMDSPIRFVMNSVQEAIVNISPENLEQFKKDYPDFILEYLDSHKWIVNVDVDKKHINISKKVLEVLWSVSFSYMTFYLKVCSGKMITEETIIDLTKDETVHKSMLLLNWIYRTWINEENEGWNDKLPQPIENPENDSMEKVADELCLSSIAFIVHHELNHIRLKHTGKSDIECEKEADIAATDWLLNHNLDEDGMMFIKRALGIAIAFEVLTAKGIYTGNFGGISHPYSYDRLFNCLDRYITNANHIVWAFLSAILKLHFDNAKIITPLVVYDDFKQCVNSQIDFLSKLKKSR